MTKEEAIKHLYTYSTTNGSGQTSQAQHEEAKRMGIKALEKEPAIWCTDCKEYDKDEHCCHRWNNVIRNTVEEMKQESVIDKIRAEIEEQVLESLSDSGDDWFAAEKVNECLEIIDKYREESEDK